MTFTSYLPTSLSHIKKPISLSTGFFNNIFYQQKLYDIYLCKQFCQIFIVKYCLSRRIDKVKITDIFVVSEQRKKKTEEWSKTKKSKFEGSVFLSKLYKLTMTDIMQVHSQFHIISNGWT